MHRTSTTRVSSSTAIEATPEQVFTALTDTATHAAIDGTGWVRASVAGDRIGRTGQVFRMAMYHPNHPDGDYETYNRVEVFDRPSAIAWKPGYLANAETGELGFGGWTWRYDLDLVGRDATRVTLTYDWSAVSTEVRERIGFPPFDQAHLENSLEHLARLATEHR